MTTALSVELFFDALRAIAQKKLPFVVFKKPNEPALKAYFQKDDQLYFSNDFSEKGFVFAPFDEKEKTIIIPDHYSYTTSIEQTDPENIATRVPSGIPNETTKEKLEHIALVNKGKAAISKGICSKIVLSRKEILPIKSTDPLELFIKLTRHYPNAFVYCWHHPKIGTWLGATPETLLELTNNQFLTMALAGTQHLASISNNSKHRIILDEVHWGDKEKEEQQMVTDHIVNALKSIVSSLEIGKRFTRKAGSLLHLCTTIQGVMPKVNLKQLVSKLHPTAAVCGLPTTSAKAFIGDNEGYQRSFYTGFLGEINGGSKTENCTTLYVNLRCMELHDTNAILYVGGGITNASDSQKEWEETVSKTSTMKAILNMVLKES